MTLHQLNTLTYPTSVEAAWQTSLQAGDQILLIEEAILRTLHSTIELETLLTANQTSLYYLQSDAEAYGITPTLGQALSDEQWVDTTLSATKNISW